METQNGTIRLAYKRDDDIAAELPDDIFKESLAREIESAGGEYQEDPAFEGSVGITMFDVPNSKDNVLSVLVPFKDVRNIPSQSIVEIRSRSRDNGGDGRVYRGVVVEGPFYEPDGLRADAPIIVTTSVRGTMFMPRFHGKLSIEVIGEIIDGTIVPPRFRPLPNSPVFVLDASQTAEALGIGGNITLGLAIGHDDIEVQIPSDKKMVFARHFGILGTTGGGKSTTVSGLINQYQQAGVSTILIDTEGEYTALDQKTEDPNMITALKRRGKGPKGVNNTYVYHLIGRETNNPDHPNLIPFSLEFERLSPYAVMEILGLNEAQQQRYLKAYDLAKQLLMKLKIYPSTEQEQEELMELDEMERGFPRLSLELMYDVVRACAMREAKELRNENNEPNFYIRTKFLFQEKEKFLNLIETADLPHHVWSWRKVQGRLSQLLRLKIFDHSAVQPLNYQELTTSGRISIIDLSDTDSPQINNLVIAELLRGMMDQQNENYKQMQTNNEQPNKVMVIIEEAHEFLSSERIKQMPVLWQQVARIARRGRKRWLGLTFVTQLPQHLPNEVLGLINSYVLHKINDADVISRLKRSIGGIDDSLWRRLPNLAAGQAIVTTPSLTRPLLVAIDPTPCKLLMVE
ncbi:hypothetical protein U27_01007 [Candidatus Vecturithrix granuli]|uniref:Helicase HerA central domain-containing protein n=1 Tax=Vecturithrix granuli TaxID=1499967 RepID=A0A081C954_VECG1|nr:hypothetical protein U27_01007 [Candidatus Vecturithrix granuli]